jgi:hypothetical protein
MQTGPLTTDKPEEKLKGQYNGIWIADRRFRASLRLLRHIQETIIAEHISVLGNKEEEKNLHLGYLQMFNISHSTFQLIRKEKRRYPSLEEWQGVEGKLITLSSKLSRRQLQRVQLRQSSWILVFGGFCLLLSAMALLWIALNTCDNCYPAWLACAIPLSAIFGALGSIAFIYVYALSTQLDSELDATSPPMVVIRVLMGALFAMILSLPFWYNSFYKFGHILDPSPKDQQPELKDVMALLFPFVIGFSTPLVLSILNRLVESVQTLFGVRPHPNHAGLSRSIEGRSDDNDGKN